MVNFFASAYLIEIKNILLESLKTYSLVGSIKMIRWGISCNTSEMV